MANDIGLITTHKTKKTDQAYKAPSFTNCFRKKKPFRKKQAK